MSDGKEVMIVEDAEENVVFLSQILEDHGYSYRVARNGAEALAAMRESRPDLVLLDIFMPRKSGITVYQEMKRDTGLSVVPVIIITGASVVTGVDMTTGEAKPKETYADDLSRGFGETLREKLMGFDPEGYVEKPVEPDVLIEKIEQVLAD